MQRALEGLNEAQREAVTAPIGPLLILAGAGAGKTRTLIERIRHLVYSGADPRAILAITFTNKAAREMRERLAGDSEPPLVLTFHSLGVRILREQATKIGFRKHFAIFDRDDSKKAVKEALESLSLDPKTHEPGKILAMISKEKGHGITVEEAETGQAWGYRAEVVLPIWRKYEEILRRDQALDFDDLLLRTRNLLRDDLTVRNYYKDYWRHLLIDEYQDTNRVQYDIARLLVGAGKSICVVGDIDQNIYSWRGADIKNILDFESDYPDAKVVILEENYRSSANILEAANAVIEKNKIRRKKILRTANAGGEKLRLLSAYDEAHEAELITERVGEIMRAGTPADEIAVLYRANFQSRVLEEAFLRAGLEYQLIGTKFFERKEVKDVVAYLRAALNPDSLADLKRIINVPTRGLGKTTILKFFAGQKDDLPLKTRAKLDTFLNLLERIAEFAKQSKPSEMIRFIIKESGLEAEWKDGRDEGLARLENAYELANFASRYDALEPEEGTLAFLSDAALQSDQDEIEEEKPAVRLMTVHASKGLEFDAVFITGLEEGLFPHERSNEAELTEAQSEEERRLFYVALTRARKQIFLTWAAARTLFGRRLMAIPSTFIMDIPAELLEAETIVESESWRRRPLLDIEF